MNWRRHRRAAAMAAVGAALLAVVAPRLDVVDPAELEAVGLEGSFEAAAWPAWLPAAVRSRLPHRSPVLRGVKAVKGRWRPAADAAMKDLPPLEWLSVSGTTIPDASLRAILNDQPGLTRLRADGCPLGIASLEAVVSHGGLKEVSIDCDAIGDAPLLAAAARAAGRLDWTLMRRAARRFVARGGARVESRRDRYGESWSTVGSSAADRSGRRRAILNPPRRDPGLVLRLEADGGAALPPSSVELLSAVPEIGSLSLRGVSLPGVPLLAVPRTRQIDLNDCDSSVVELLRGNRAARWVSLTGWRGGDGPLRTLDLPEAERLIVECAEGATLTGSFLTAARLPKLKTLVVTGDGGGPPGRADFSGMPGLQAVVLSDLAVDGPSLAALWPDGAPVAKDGTVLRLKNLPNVAAADLAAAVRWLDVSHLWLQKGVNVSADCLRAAADSKVGHVRIEAESLPPAGELAEALRGFAAGSRGADLTVVDRGGAGDRVAAVVNAVPYANIHVVTE